CLDITPRKNLVESKKLPERQLKAFDKVQPNVARLIVFISFSSFCRDQSRRPQSDASSREYPAKTCLLLRLRGRAAIARRCRAVVGTAATQPERPAVDLAGAKGGAEVVAAVALAAGCRAAVFPLARRVWRAFVLDVAVDHRAGEIGAAGAGRRRAGVGAGRGRDRRAGVRTDIGGV